MDERRRFGIIRLVVAIEIHDAHRLRALALVHRHRRLRPFLSPDQRFVAMKPGKGNVERIDLLYNGTAGIVDNNSLAIGVFDRGTGDAFSVAVITGVDSHGNPTSYGAFITVSNTAWTGSNELVTAANSNSAIFNSTGGDPTDYLIRYDSSTSLASFAVSDGRAIWPFYYCATGSAFAGCCAVWSNGSAALAD